MRKIDSMIIADTHWPRAMELVDFARKMPEVDQKGVGLVYADRDQEMAVKDMGRNFERLIRLALKKPQNNNLVIMNLFAATEGRVLEILRAAEEEYGRQTRRFLITCKTHSKVAQALGDQRPLLHRIPYNADRSDYLELLEQAVHQSPVERALEL